MNPGIEPGAEPATEPGTEPGDGRTMKRGLDRLVAVLTATELTIACVAAAMIFVLVLFQAVQRYLPLPQVVWTGELSQFALIWLTFVAAGVLVTRNGHIAIQLVDSLPSAMAVRIIQTFAMVLVALIAGAFAWACWELVSSAGFLTSPALGLPMSWVYAVALIGLVSATVRAAFSAVRIARFGMPPAEYDEITIATSELAAEGEDRR
jgi:TRAP-type C4-dicarboxylate transport system permease small subunit